MRFFVGVSLLLTCCLCYAKLGSSAQGQSDAFLRTRHGGARLAITSRVRTGSQPKSVTVSPNGRLIAVQNFGRVDQHNVYLFASNLDRVGQIDLPGNAVESVFSADGLTLYVSNFRDHGVDVVDVSACYSATVSAPCRPVPRTRITTGHHPKFMALSPDGQTLYAANWGSLSVSVLDLGSNQEVRRLRTLERPRGLVVDSQGTLYAASFGGHVVHVFPAGATTESRRMTMCQNPRHLLLSPDERQLWVTCTRGALGVYDIATGHRVGLATLGANPRSIARSTDGRYVASANFGGRSVTLVDMQQRTHRELPTGDGRIVGVAIDPNTLRIFGTSWDTSELVVVEPR